MSSIVLFWLPLAATWLMMSVEGPYIAAIVARMPAAERNLAAFGVATSLAWLIESPIMMLFSAATALVHDRASYVALRRFANLLNAAVTIAMIVLTLPPVFRLIGEKLIGLPPAISDQAHAATLMLILWPAAIGYRRFYQGVLVRHRLTRRVAYGTVVRLVAMSATAALLAFLTSLPGATIGAMALIAGVVGEALASRWMARHVVSSLLESDHVAPGAPLTLPFIARFYYPLALTSVLSMALGPLVTFGLGRGKWPVESLAVWPVITALVFLFRSGGIAYQEVSIALLGDRREHYRPLASFARRIGGVLTLGLAVVAFTPLTTLWFQRVSGLSPDLASLSVLPARILILMPALEVLLSLERGVLVHAHSTRLVTWATVIEVATIVGVLLAGIAGLDLVGIVAAASGLLLGRIASTGFLWRPALRGPADIR